MIACGHPGASWSDEPGIERTVEHPLAVVILGGLVTSTLLNLFLLPALYAAFGRSRKDRTDDRVPVAAHAELELAGR